MFDFAGRHGVSIDFLIGGDLLPCRGEIPANISSSSAAGVSSALIAGVYAGRPVLFA